MPCHLFVFPWRVTFCYPYYFPISNRFLLLSCTPPKSSNTFTFWTRNIKKYQKNNVFSHTLPIFTVAILHTYTTHRSLSRDLPNLLKLPIDSAAALGLLLLFSYTCTCAYSRVANMQDTLKYSRAKLYHLASIISRILRTFTLNHFSFDIGDFIIR